MVDPGAYWDAIVDDWGDARSQQLWRAHSDAVNLRLLRPWLGGRRVARLLKTDLFDEAVGVGLYPLLTEHADEVVGVDISPEVVRRAHERYPDLVARVADLRQLPWGEGEFDIVVSNSSLDHFATLAELARAISELQRVLKPDGQLLITLDNRANPVVALRVGISFNRARRLGLAPYFIGATLGPRGLRRALEAGGFRVHQTTAVMHAPPRIVAAISARLERRSGRSVLARHVQWSIAFERLQRLPTRYLSGHFVAAYATKL